MKSPTSFRPAIRALLVASLFSSLVFGQAKPGGGQTGGGQAGGGQSGGGPTGGLPGGTGSRPTPTDPNQIPQQRVPSTGIPDQQRVVFLSGRVMMDDGTPPPEPVLIERVCMGTNRPEGRTDAKGRFHIQLGQSNADMLSDASFGGVDDGVNRRNSDMLGGANVQRTGVAERDLNNCEVRAVLAGFRSDTVSLAGRRALDNPDVGTIVLHHLAKAEGFTFSATSAMAPKDAKKAYEKGTEQLKKGKVEAAEKELSKATDLYPKYAAAWYALGLACQSENKIAEAKHAYSQAVAADAKFVSPYTQMARIAIAEKKWKEAADYSEALLRLNPYVVDGQFLAAVANYNLHQLDPALEHAREAAKLDAERRNTKINHLLGVILAEKQDYKGAAENMRIYLRANPDASDAMMVRQQLNQIEQRAGVAQTAQP